MVYKRFYAIIFFNLFLSINYAQADQVNSLIVENCEPVKENFLEKSKISKKPQLTRGKLKEKVGQEMADLMQQIHKEIELGSQLCQEIFAQIETLVNQENSKLSNATFKDLQSYLDEIEKINLETQARVENLKNYKKFFKSGCIN